MNHTSSITPERKFFAVLWLAVILSLFSVYPTRTAAARSIPASNSVQKGSLYSPRYAPSAVLSFSAPAITLDYGDTSADFSLTITNNGSLAAQNIRLYVDFGSVEVTATNAAYTTAADPYFTLPDISGGGSFTLNFTLGYTAWCTNSSLARSLVWQPTYSDSLGNAYTTGAQTSELTVNDQPSLSIDLSGGSSVLHEGADATYTLTSTYSGATSCSGGSMGQVSVVVDVPTGFDVVNTGGGSLSGTTLTFTYTQPASLNVSFVLRATNTLTCGSTNTVTATADCTDCGTSVPSATVSRNIVAVCADPVSATKIVTPASCPRCGEMTYTNTYSFPSGYSGTLNDLVFTDLAENGLAYQTGSHSVIFDGADITVCTGITGSPTGGTISMDFSGCLPYELAEKGLSITYNMKTTAATGVPCTDLDFFSNSQLSGVGDIVYSAAPVQVDAPKVTAAISGLGSTVAVGETKPVTVTLTAENALTKDASFTLSKDNYYLPNPAATSCSGTVSPTPCTPTSDASGYHWYFADGFDTAGKYAVIQMDVRKLATTNGNLDGVFKYDELCQNDGSYDNACSTSTSASPALVRSGDVAVSIEPAVYSTSGKAIQWKTSITNQGTGPATNVYVDHVLGAGLDYVSSTVDEMTGVTITADQNHSGAAINGAVTLISELAPGERREIIFNAFRTAKNNLTYAATAAWGFNGADAQTPVIDTASVDLLPLIVTNANDSGPGSLRQIVTDAESGDTITFDNDYTIILDSEIYLDENVIIDGTGHTIIVDGGGANRVFYIGNNTVYINQLTITNGNQLGGGGGIYLYNGTLYLLNTTISGNTSTDPTYAGGGIYNYYGTVNIFASTFSGNTATNPGGSGDAGSGGAIHNNGGTVTITNSTISGNSSSNASGGPSVGGIYSDGGTLSIKNATIANNTATATNGGSVVGGIYKSGSLITVTDSILAGNQSGKNCSGPINSTGNNLEWGVGGASSTCAEFIASNPLLSALGDYGGATQTMALLPGSAAISQSSGCLSTDQRGVDRPPVTGCDIGAFESRGFSLAISGGNNQSAPVGTAFADPLSVTVASAFSEPVDSGQVTFTPPASGASAAITTSPATISSGSATVTATANTTVGGPYLVSASITGESPVAFSLTNENINHTVTFAANGGDGVMADQVSKVTAALSANTFTRSRYTFSGWNTAADGSGTAYTDGASYAFLADLSLFAQWAPVAPDAFTKSAPANGLTGLSTSPTLSWNASTGQTDYEYCVDMESSGSCSGSWISTSNSTAATPIDLNYDTIYRWQVRAVHAGLYTYADAGTMFTFRTAPLDYVNLSIHSTSESQTGDSEDGSPGNERPVAIGEQITYRVLAVIPESISISLQVEDVLPSGLQYVPGSARVSYLADTSPSFNGDFSGIQNQSNPTFVFPSTRVSFDGSSGTLNFDFGSVINNDGDANPERFVIDFDVVVMDDVQNNAGDIYSNTVDVIVDEGFPTEVINSSNTVFVEIVEPVLALTKTFSPATPGRGETVSLTLEVTNLASNGATGPVFDINVTDSLDDWLDVTAVDVSFNAAALSSGSSYTDGSSLTSGFATGVSDQIDVDISGLPVDGAATITITLQVDPAGDWYQLPHSITNTASIAADSLASQVVPDDEDRAYFDSDTDNLSVISSLPFDLTVQTEIHNSSHTVITSAALLEVVHASATVSGNGPMRTGSVTFSFFNNLTCTGTAAGSEIVSLDVGGKADMIASAVLTADGLSFLAHYDGDTNYPAADGVCTAILTSQFPTVLVTSVNTSPYDGQVLTSSISSVSVQFNMDVFHTSNANQNSATYPGNYRLLGPGTDAVFNTSPSTGCLDGAAGDDVSYNITTISYDPASYVATIGINSGVQLLAGSYRLYVCGSTSITDPTETNELNNGQDSVIEFSILSTGRGGSSKKSVATGFIPGMTTVLPEQPAEKAYTASDLWIEIPSLGIHQPIVGVPQTDAGWDVSWLGDEIGYLQGTAFPTWAGNSVLTGHVTGADGLPGVFADLGKLKWGQEIIIHAYGQKYVYEVQTVDLSAGPDTGKIMNKHEDLPWLTLITCRGYDEKTQTYRYRTVVRAVQVSVEEE